MRNLFINGVRHKASFDVASDAYPFGIAALKKAKNLEFEHSVIFFVGENGSGKSTLLEAIAINYGFNPEGGSRNFNFSTAETHSELSKHIVVSKGVKRASDGYFLRAESFYNVISEIDNIPGLASSYGGTSLHHMSHGEGFMALATERFFGNGLYILDEPEAALSPIRQMALLARIHDLVLSNSQFIIATHSPILLAYPDAQILSFDDSGISQLDYQDTEHYRVYKMFLDDPGRAIRLLWG